MRRAGSSWRRRRRAGGAAGAVRALGEEIAIAREWLGVELLGDFPFVGDADRAHAIALLLTLLLREVSRGGVPLFVVSKPTPRTGAGLLTKVLSIVHWGSPIAATTISRDEEEMRKRLTATLLSAPELVLLDNLHGRLDSAALAAILTTPTWEDRLLGRSHTVRLSVRSAFIATGNNVTMSTETSPTSSSRRRRKRIGPRPSRNSRPWARKPSTEHLRGREPCGPGTREGVRLVRCLLSGAGNPTASGCRTASRISRGRSSGGILRTRGGDRGNQDTGGKGDLTMSACQSTATAAPTSSPASSATGRIWPRGWGPENSRRQPPHWSLASPTPPSRCRSTRIARDGSS